MLNNKGFAVSAVLYTLLIAFLLFLGATLAMFSASNSTVGSSNNDLTDGSDFKAQQVKTGLNSSGGNCLASQSTKVNPDDYYWYESKNDILVKINSRYGTMYWPRDFEITVNNGVTEGESEAVYKNVKVECFDNAGKKISCSGVDLKNKKETVVQKPVIDTTLTSFNVYNSDRKIESSGVSSVAFPDAIYVELSELIGLDTKTVNDTKYGASIEYYEAFSSIDAPADNYVDLYFPGVSDVQCYTRFLDEMTACENVDYPENSEYYAEFVRFEELLNSHGDFEDNLFIYYDSTTNNNIKYFPVLYVFTLDEDNWYKDSYDNVDTFNKILYYDLAPSNESLIEETDNSSARVLNVLTMAFWLIGHNDYDSTSFYLEDEPEILSGKEFDQVALFNNENRISPYFFAKDELLLGDVTSIPPESTPSLPKPESYVNLRITDTISDATIDIGLYDICE